VYLVPIGTPAELQLAVEPVALANARPAITAPRDPEPSGLTPDEIRRIVRDIIG